MSLSAIEAAVLYRVGERIGTETDDPRILAALWWRVRSAADDAVAEALRERDRQDREAACR
ncbi:MAG TPA: hypothetical protein VEF89_19985 [Solirubrobacteraceae bacterium]|nr:hypothetical protein [Solirubrobacteraceae bacterium]